MKLMLLLITFTLLSAFASASFTGEWGEWQNAPENTGREPDNKGRWTDWGEVTTVDEGYAGQPLILDVDNDGDLEIVTRHSTFFQILNNDLSLLDELNLGTGVATLDQIIALDDWNSNDLPEIVYFYDHSISVWEYNGTSFNSVVNHTITNTGSYTEMACNDAGTDKCVLISDNGSNDYVIKFDLTDKNETSIGTVNSAAGSSIAFSDIDRDTRKEIVFTMDADGNGRQGLAVVDENISLSPPYLDTVFSTDGLLDNIVGSATSAKVLSDPIIDNIDGAGDKEIIVVANKDSPDFTSIIAYKSSGAVKWSTTVANFATNTRLYNPSIGIINATRVVVGGHSWHTDATNGVPANKIIAVDKDGVKRWEYAEPNDEEVESHSIDDIELIMADMNNDGNDDLVWGYRVYDLYNNVTLLNLSTFNDGSQRISMGDVDDDNDIDMVTGKTSQTRLIQSSARNAGPVLTGRYGKNFCGNICVGSTVTYVAKDCDTGESTCNYENDVATDQERVAANCWNASQINGSLSLQNPTVGCHFAVTGTFPVKLYIQDEQNLDWLSEFNTVVATVINGTAGLTCNLPCSAADAQPLNGTQLLSNSTDANANIVTQESDIAEAVAIFTFQSPFVKTLLVLIFTIGLIFRMSQMGVRNTGVYVASVVFLWALLAMLGFMSWLIVIFVGIITALLAALKMGSGGSENG